LSGWESGAGRNVLVRLGKPAVALTFPRHRTIDNQQDQLSTPRDVARLPAPSAHT
jgi:hypothetical protein